MATPIGNLGDLSPRAADALAAADYWIVEDSRVSGKLAAHLSLKKPMRLLNDHVSEHQLERLLRELESGRAALLTDGGTPVISDPGALLIDGCYERGIRVEGVPGPSAPMLALSLSGFFGQRFVFVGFLGRKAKDVRKELQPFADSPMTIILFESVHRFEATLKTASETIGPRRYAICREMTKSFEQVWRGVLPAVPTEQELPRRGELTIVLEGLRRSMPI